MIYSHVTCCSTQQSCAETEDSLHIGFVLYVASGPPGQKAQETSGLSSSNLYRPSVRGIQKNHFQNDSLGQICVYYPIGIGSGFMKTIWCQLPDV